MIWAMTSLQAFQMLHVERRVDADAGLQQLHDVLPALGVRHAGRVGMGQLVDEDQLRPLGQRGLQVELDQLRAAIGHFLASQHIETEHEGLGLGPDVRLDVADEHVDAFAGLLAARLEHRVGLADPGAAPKKIFSLPRAFLASSA